MTATTIQLWRAPSGRLHWLRHCSGGMPHGRVHSVRVDAAQYREAMRNDRLCRCAQRLGHRFDL